MGGFKNKRTPILNIEPSKALWLFPKFMMVRSLAFLLFVWPIRPRERNHLGRRCRAVHDLCLHASGQGVARDLHVRAGEWGPSGRSRRRYSESNEREGIYGERDILRPIQSCLSFTHSLTHPDISTRTPGQPNHTLLSKHPFGRASVSNAPPSWRSPRPQIANVGFDRASWHDGAIDQHK